MDNQNQTPLAQQPQNPQFTGTPPTNTNNIQPISGNPSPEQVTVISQVGQPQSKQWPCMWVKGIFRWNYKKGTLVIDYATNSFSFVPARKSQKGFSIPITSITSIDARRWLKTEVYTNTSTKPVRIAIGSNTTQYYPGSSVVRDTKAQEVVAEIKSFLPPSVVLKTNRLLSAENLVNGVKR